MRKGLQRGDIRDAVLKDGRKLFQGKLEGQALGAGGGGIDLEELGIT